MKFIVTGLIFLAVALIVLSALPLGVFAELKHDSKELFWMVLPDGWQWYEDNEGVTIMNPESTRSLRIDFVASDGITTGQDEMELVEGAMSSRTQEVASRNGKTVMKVDRKIDGAFALQRGFLISAPEGMRQATAIVFFKKRHLFSIYFEAPREFQRMEMEAIVNTITFEPPAPPKEGEVEVPPVPEITVTTQAP